MDVCDEKSYNKRRKQKMKKVEFYEVLAKKLEKTPKEIKAIMEAFQEQVIAINKKDDEVVLDFGKFEVKKKPATPARKGINPFTKEEVTIPAKPASVKPSFRPSKKYKDGVQK